MAKRPLRGPGSWNRRRERGKPRGMDPPAIQTRFPPNGREGWRKEVRIGAIASGRSSYTRPPYTQIMVCQLTFFGLTPFAWPVTSASMVGGTVGKYALDGTPVNESLIGGLVGPEGIAIVTPTTTVPDTCATIIMMGAGLAGLVVLRRRLAHV